MKKPITQFTFQDAEYIVTKVSELLRSFIALIGKFVNGIQNGEIYTFGQEESEAE